MTIDVLGYSVRLRNDNDANLGGAPRSQRLFNDVEDMKPLSCVYDTLRPRR